MANAFETSDDDFQDSSLLDSSAEISCVVLEPCEECVDNDSEWTGAPRCEKCDARLVSDVVSICRKCGWYASLGQFVEVDPDWEVVADPESAVETEAAPRPDHLQVWLGLLPRWSWVIIGSVVFLAIESTIVRFTTPAGSTIRTTWSLSQLTIGLIAAFCCHIFNFLVIAADDAEFGALDLLLRPLRLWGRAVQHLPGRLWVFNTAVSGLAAAMLSVLVIGGIPYDRLLDWGIKQPPKQNLMGAVMEQVQKADGDNQKDLESAINDFAGKQGEESKDKPKNDQPKPHKNADCVILGYVLDRDGLVSSLVLGTVDGGHLVYAGNVTPKLSEGELKQLADTLKSILSQRPLIHIQYDAIWVQPKLTCRVNYAERSKSGHLNHIEWDKLLGSISTH